jgi:hypothetical protein
MAFMVRIRSWRTRRKARKDEQLIALGGVSAEDSADAARVRDDLDKRQQAPGHQAFTKHAGEEGKTHY